MSELTAEDHLRRALELLGWADDPETQQTPERVASMLRELSAGEEPVLSTFAVTSPGPVVLRDMPFYALCAHHLLPFFGKATVAYWPGQRVGGFSGIARLLQHHCQGPQLQERIAHQLKQSLIDQLQPRGVIVRLSARQLCMEMRGARCSADITVEAAWGGLGDDLQRALGPV